MVSDQRRLNQRQVCLDPWPRCEGTLEETKRVARLLDIVARISTRPKTWTRRALSLAFEISERRIQEDLEILVHRLHLPLAHCRTGYYLREPNSLPAVTFAFGEAAALLLAGSVGRATSGVSSVELTAALARLKEVFPPEFRHLLDTLETSAAGAVPSDHRQQMLELIQEALATGTAIRMVYATASRDNVETDRIVEPYALVPYVRSFHLVGYCYQRREVRIFKVDRIRKIELTGQHFAVPEGFDLAEYLGGDWGMLRGAAGAPEAVEISFTSRAGRWVSEERWHSSQKAAWQEDGSLLFTLVVGVTPAFVRWVLYYGDDAKVLRPSWLAEAVCQEATRTLARYHSSSGDPASPIGPNDGVGNDGERWRI